MLAQIGWHSFVGPGWLAQIGWHRFVGHGWLAQPGWPRYVGWLAGFVGSKYFQILSWYSGPGSPRIFEPIFFVRILGEPDQRYPLLTHVLKVKMGLQWLFTTMGKCLAMSLKMKLLKDVYILL